MTASDNSTADPRLEAVIRVLREDNDLWDYAPDMAKRILAALDRVEGPSRPAVLVPSTRQINDLFNMPRQGLSHDKYASAQHAAAYLQGLDLSAAWEGTYGMLARERGIDDSEFAERLATAALVAAGVMPEPESADGER